MPSAPRWASSFARGPTFPTVSLLTTLTSCNGTRPGRNRRKRTRYAAISGREPPKARVTRNTSVMATTALDTVATVAHEVMRDQVNAMESAIFARLDLIESRLGITGEEASRAVLDRLEARRAEQGHGDSPGPVS